MTSKTVCPKHEQAYDAGASCPWCEPEATDPDLMPRYTITYDDRTGEWGTQPLVKITADDAVPVGSVYALYGTAAGQIAQLWWLRNLGVITDEQALELLDLPVD